MKSDLNPLVMIPARMASTRLPGKPMAMIGDAPMIVHCYRRAVESGLARVVIACDHPDIAAAIKEEGGEAILTNPDLPSGSDRIYTALQELENADDHEIIINLQGDMPTIDPAIIAQVLTPLEKDDACDIATLAAEISTEEEKQNPAVVKLAHAQDGRALYFSRQLIPHGQGPHYHHIGIYAYRRNALQKFVSLPPSPLEKREKLEQLRALEAGMMIKISIVDTIPLGVDTPEQLQMAVTALT